MKPLSKPFITDEEAKHLAKKYGTPLFVYDENLLRDAAKEITDFPNAYGLLPRYAMKANPNAAILKILHSEGIHIDASSGYEAERAIRAGIPGAHITITGQALAKNLKELLQKGVLFNACSLDQIEALGSIAPGGTLGLRFNPGLGSGGTNRTNVGGPASSFGIWHEHVEEAKALVAKYNLTVSNLHTHIGSGSDPAVWQHVAKISLALLTHFESATSFDLGGGYKIGRMQDEKSTDIKEIAAPVVKAFEEFFKETGRKIRLEVEPGTFLVAQCGGILAQIASTTTTGKEGYLFYKLDAGMTEILRPSLYGAQHPLWVIPKDKKEKEEYVDALVVGHCCESGDILTPAPNDPEGLLPRSLLKATAGDLLFIGGTGAYCAAMSAKNYNSFPEAPEILKRLDGSFSVIRKRQTMEQMLENEVSL
jgi:diaminopimelate decarboxylase